MNQLDLYVADAVLGIDTLWGGDVMCPSGTGRFIADSWFSDEPLPAAYTHPAAARCANPAASAPKSIDRDAFEAYLRDVESSRRHRRPAQRSRELRRTAPRLSRAAWRFASKSCGTSPWKSSARAIRFPTRAPSKPRPASRPNPRTPRAKRERVAELLGRAGHSTSQSGGILAAVDAWRSDRVTPMASVQALGQAVIAHFDALSAKNLVPHLPPELAPCPAPTSISCPSRTHGFPAR